MVRDWKNFTYLSYKSGIAARLYGACLEEPDASGSSFFYAKIGTGEKDD